MKKLALVAFLLAASAAADQPLTFWRYGMPDQMRLQSALDCALARWRAATCLQLDVSYYAAHWVRFALPQDMPAGATGVTSGASWNSMRIRLMSTLADESLCPMLTHEIGHVLRRNSGHSDEDGSMSYVVTHVVSSPTSRITAGDIDLVCSKQLCACAIPEPLD